MIKSLFNAKRALAVIGTLFVFGVSCSTTEVFQQPVKDTPQKRSSEIEELARIVETSPVFSKTITGFTLYDPAADTMLYGINEDKYMTPASNTKIFTYYAGLNVLDSQIPALSYVIRGDSLIFWGTGDPSFLHPDDFGTTDVYDFLNEFEGNIYFSDSNFKDEVLGPGWAWSDYDAYYSAEKSPFPIYGNYARFTLERIEQVRISEVDGEYVVNPKFFGKYVEKGGVNEEGRLSISRERVGNNFEYSFKSDTVRYQTDKPFHYTPELIVELLADTLNREVGYLADYKMPEDRQTIYGMEADSLYKRMMLPSDNNLAEQIMMMISGTIGNELNVRKGINYVVENYLNDLPDAPNWRDGSGLSRYNLFTPRTVAALLKKLDDKVNNDELLFDTFPQGGVQGTIRNLYSARDGGPAYVFAKTGTLSNSHCLSGYVITDTGRKLIFSFMNNNYVIPTREVQSQMEEVLWYIHTNF